MENKKAKRDILILALIFAVVIGGAAALYQKLSGEADSPMLAGQATAAPAVTVAPAQAGEQAAQATPEVAGPMPLANLAKDFTVYTDAGEAKRLIELRGKPAVINFFASWCGPCKIEMPYFEEAYKTYGETIEFMMVNLCAYGNDRKENAKKLVEDNGWTFPVYFDTAGSASTAYSVRSMPTTIFVSADGELVGKQIGAMSAAQLQAQIDQLLVK